MIVLCHVAVSVECKHNRERVLALMFLATKEVIRDQMYGTAARHPEYKKEPAGASRANRLRTQKI